MAYAKVNLNVANVETSEVVYSTQGADVAMRAGGGLGIGKLAASAMEGIARQPNASGDIRGAMIVAAGLIEGATLFALVIMILLVIK